MAQDTRFLIQRGRMWYLQRGIPRELRERLGGQTIQFSLGTDRLSVAQNRRWRYLRGYEHAWEAARKNPKMSKSEIKKLAHKEAERLGRLEDDL